MPRVSFPSVRSSLWLLILVTAAPIVGLLGYLVQQDRRLATVEVETSALRAARLVASSHEELVHGARALLFGVTQLPEVRRGDAAACSAVLARLLRQYPFYANLGVTRPTGEIFCSAVPLPQPVTAAGMAWFQRAVRSRDFVVGQYQISPSTGKPVLLFGTPVLDSAGHVQAVIFAALDLAWFNILVGEARLPEGAVVTVVDRKGTILARQPDLGGWVGKALPDAPIIRAMASRDEGTIETAGVDGVRRLYAFTPLGSAPEPGVQVSVGFSNDAAFAEADRRLAYSLIALGLAVAAALATAWIVGDRLVLRPVRALAGTTGRLGAGDLTARSGMPYGAGELGQLARAIDEMAEAQERRAADRRRGEVALHESERKYRELVQHANSIILRWTREGHITFLNEYGQSFFGYPEAEILGRHVVGTIVPESEGSNRDLRPLMDEICADPTKFERNINENMRRNGERVWIAWTNKTVLDEHGQVKEILSVGSDITERKQAVDTLRVRTQQLEAIRAVSAEITRELDLPTLLTLIHRRATDLLGTGIGILFLWDEADQVLVPWVWHGLGDRTQELRLKLGEGVAGTVAQRREGMIVNDFRSSPYATPLLLEPTHHVGVIAEPLLYGESLLGTITVDTTDPGRRFTDQDQQLLRLLADQAAIAIENARLFGQVRSYATEMETRVAKRTAELEVAMTQAQAADRLKSAFLATMSHELRTPLNSIIGFTGILLQGLAGPLNDEQTKQLTMVRDSSRHLLALINDILDLSKIEAGQLEVVRKPCDMRAAIEQVMRTVAPQANKKGVALLATMGPDVGEILSDRRRVEQVLLNLLSNAIKFTERGEVRIECRTRGGWLETCVRDTGMGIQAEDLGKLFEPFRQLETGLARRHEGTGLGLSICKRLVELLGGKIRVESVWGDGSTFTFTLPNFSPREKGDGADDLGHRG